MKKRISFIISWSFIVIIGIASINCAATTATSLSDGLISFQDSLSYISISNKTGYDIRFLFIDPSETQYFGPDLLGNTRTLDNETSLGFYILHRNICDEFDITGIAENNNYFSLENYSVCDDMSEDIVITADDLSADEQDIEFIEATIENTTAFDMYHIFISPSDTFIWATNLLDEGALLQSDQSFSLFFPGSSTGVSYDFMAVDEDGDEYIFTFIVYDEDINVPIEFSDIIM